MGVCDMSGQGKRVLPPSATTTAALIPISHSAYANGGALDRSRPNDDLIDQLVGGLIQDQQPAAEDHNANFFKHGSDFGANTRTYSIDDEEIDEPPVPIPSTWRHQDPTPEPNWYIEQLRASVFGFGIGLFVVVPAVMLLTGQAERIPSWQSIMNYAEENGSKIGLEKLASTSTVPSADKAPALASKAPASAAPASEAPAFVAPSSAAPASEAPAYNSTEYTTSAVVTDANVNRTAPAGAKVAAAGAPTSVEPQQGAVSGDEPNVAPTEGGDDKIASVTVFEVKPPEATKPAVVETKPEIDEPPAAIPQPAETDKPAAAPASGAAEATNAGPLTGETTTAAVDPKPTPDQPSPAIANPAPEAAPAAAAPEAAPAVAAPEARPPSAAPQERPSAVATAEPNARPDPAATPTKDLSSISIAYEKIKGGDVDGGRVMLARLASKGSSEAVFALAETFDPNVLAAWGTLGAESNSEKARMFYSMALAQGISRAEQRLKALQP